MDDPAVAPLVDPYLPKLAPTDVLAGRSHITAIVLWRTDNSVPSRELAVALAHSAIWQEAPLGTDEAHLWRRKMSEPAKPNAQAEAKAAVKPAAK